MGRRAAVVAEDRVLAVLAVRAWQVSPPCRQHGNLSRQYQQRVACSRLPPTVPIDRSCGEAASGTPRAAPPGSRVGLELGERRARADPRAVDRRAARRRARRRACRRSTSPSRSSGTSSCRRRARRSRCRARPPRPRRLRPEELQASPVRRALGLAQRAQHLLARDRQRADVGAGRVADRVRDRRGGRDDRRLAEPLRAEVRQVLVGDVERSMTISGTSAIVGSLYASSVCVSVAPVAGSSSRSSESVCPMPLDDPALDLALTRRAG